MNVLPPQFDIPLHPSCVPLSEEIKALGRAQIAELRELLNPSKVRKLSDLEIVQEAENVGATKGSALDFKNYLCKKKREQGNDQ